MFVFYSLVNGYLFKLNNKKHLEKVHNIHSDVVLVSLLLILNLLHTCF